MTPQELKDMTNTPEKCDQLLTGWVRLHANTNYNKGWDIVVESFSDGDILEYLSDADYDLPKAIKAIQAYIDLRQEMSDNCQF